MQTTLICYADDQMTISQQLCIKSAKEKGKIDQALSFGPTSIDKFFLKRHEDILNAPQRGGGKGFWLWKPYIVSMAINSLPENSILIYCDSGVEWINPVDYLIKTMGHESIFLFNNGHRHIDWCKAEVIEHMLPNYRDSFRQATPGVQNWKQVQASVMLFRVNNITRAFCSAWLAWCCIPGFVDDMCRGPQHGEFREHRNDQSVITNLAIQQNIHLHWWPAQYWHNSKANFPGDHYPQMFYHHRYRNNEWFKEYPGQLPNNIIADYMKRPKNA